MLTHRWRGLDSNVQFRKQMGLHGSARNPRSPRQVQDEWQVIREPGDPLLMAIVGADTSEACLRHPGRLTRRNIRKLIERELSLSGQPMKPRQMANARRKPRPYPLRSKNFGLSRVRGRSGTCCRGGTSARVSASNPLDPQDGAPPVTSAQSTRLLSADKIFTSVNYITQL